MANGLLPSAFQNNFKVTPAGPSVPTTGAFASGYNFDPNNLKAPIRSATQPVTTLNGTQYNAAGDAVGGVGLKAKSPTSNIPPPVTTLPSNQVATTSNTNAQNNPYAMTPQEASGGLMGTSLYNKRIAALQNTGASTPSSTQNGTQNTPDVSQTYTPNNGLYGQLISGLANTASQPSQAFLDAQKQAQDANAALAQSKQNEAGALAANSSTPIPLEFQQGRGQILQTQYQQQQGALSSELQGAASLEGAATGQQGAQQQGLGAAAGLAAPQPYSITTTPYNPATGQFGTMPGGQTGAFGAGQVLGNVAAGQNFQQTIAPSYNAANAVLGSLGGFLQQNPNINPSDVNYVNQLNSWLQGQNLSNPKYPELTQYLNEFLNTLTPLIGAGGNISDYKSQIVNAMLSPSASTGSIQQQLGNLFNNIATQKYQSIYQTGQGPTTPNATNTGNSIGGTTFGSFFGQ